MLLYVPVILMLRFWNVMDTQLLADEFYLQRFTIDRVASQALPALAPA